MVSGTVTAAAPARQPGPVPERPVHLLLRAVQEGRHRGFPGHDRRYAVDAGKITGELEYAPIESFETGMRKTIVWYLENLEWCKEVMGEDYQKWLEKNYS